MRETVSIFANRRAQRTWLFGVLSAGGHLVVAEPTESAAAVADLADGLEALQGRMKDHPELPFLACHEEDHDDRCHLAVGAGALECVRLDAEGSRLRGAVARAIRTGAPATSPLIPRVELLERILATTRDGWLDRSAQIDEVLRLGCRLFGQELGIVSHVVDGAATIVHAYDFRGSIQAGTEISLDSPGSSPGLAAGRALFGTRVRGGTGDRRGSYIGVPIRVADRPYGILSFSSARSTSDLRERDMEFAAAFGELIGSLLARGQSADEPRHAGAENPPTRLPHRSTVLGRLGRSVHRARKRPDYHFALLFIDLEGPVETGDSEASPAAQEALLHRVAMRICEAVGPNDGVGRFSAGEFAVLVEDTDIDQARRVADRLVAALRRPFRLADRAIVVEATVGVAMGTAADGVGNLVIAAEEALYTAKSSDGPVAVKAAAHRN